jgi:hypothetical protein
MDSLYDLGLTILSGANHLMLEAKEIKRKSTKKSAFLYRREYRADTTTTTKIRNV